jgi:hypothetical protein
VVSRSVRSRAFGHQAAGAPTLAALAAVLV